MRPNMWHTNFSNPSIRKNLVFSYRPDILKVHLSPPTHTKGQQKSQTTMDHLVKKHWWHGIIQRNSTSKVPEKKKKRAGHWVHSFGEKCVFRDRWGPAGWDRGAILEDPGAAGCAEGDARVHVLISGKRERGRSIKRLCWHGTNIYYNITRMDWSLLRGFYNCFLKG